MYERDYEEEAYWRDYCQACGTSPCTWDGEPDGFHDDYEDDPYDGYCEHGVYVGGCGIDWMCGYCEMGISAAELHEQREYRRIVKAMHQRDTIRDVFTILVGHSGMSFYEAKAQIEDYFPI